MLVHSSAFPLLSTAATFLYTILPTTGVLSCNTISAVTSLTCRQGNLSSLATSDIQFQHPFISIRMGNPSATDLHNPLYGPCPSQPLCLNHPCDSVTQPSLWSMCHTLCPNHPCDSVTQASLWSMCQPLCPNHPCDSVTQPSLWSMCHTLCPNHPCDSVTQPSLWSMCQPLCLNHPCDSVTQPSLWSMCHTLCPNHPCDSVTQPSL